MSTIVKLGPANLYLTPTGRYRCDECDSSYRYFKHLRRHSVKHTGERSYSCDVCGMSFFRSDCMQRHRNACYDKRARRAANLSNSAAATAPARQRNPVVCRTRTADDLYSDDLLNNPNFNTSILADPLERQPSQSQNQNHYGRADRAHRYKRRRGLEPDIQIKREEGEGEEQECPTHPILSPSGQLIHNNQSSCISTGGPEQDRAELPTEGLLAPSIVDDENQCRDGNGSAHGDGDDDDEAAFDFSMDFGLESKDSELGLEIDCKIKPGTEENLDADFEQQLDEELKTELEEDIEQSLKSIDEIELQRFADGEQASMPPSLCTSASSTTISTPQVTASSCTSPAFGMSWGTALGLEDDSWIDSPKQNGLTQQLSQQQAHQRAQQQIQSQINAIQNFDRVALQETLARISKQSLQTPNSMQAQAQASMEAQAQARVRSQALAQLQLQLQAQLQVQLHTQLQAQVQALAQSQAQHQTQPQPQSQLGSQSQPQSQSQAQNPAYSSWGQQCETQSQPCFKELPRALPPTPPYMPNLDTVISSSTTPVNDSDNAQEQNRQDPGSQEQSSQDWTAWNVPDYDYGSLSPVQDKFSSGVQLDTGVMVYDAWL